MSNQSDTPLERPFFFDGQRLTAADLSAFQRSEREQRWRHNCSLHNWGIAFGYGLVGARGERLVCVQPGYALDSQGRDLLLSEPVEIPIPAIASGTGGFPARYFLTISYAADEDLPALSRAGTCGSSGVIRRSEQPLLRWRDPGKTDGFVPGRDVVLGSIKVLNCRLSEPVSIAERRSAKSPSQPYVAGGRTIPGETQWILWEDNNQGIGVSTSVDTSSAGFVLTPHYQAHVVGGRHCQNNLGLSSECYYDGVSHITKLKNTSFEINVLLPQGFVGSSADDRLILLNPNIDVQLLNLINKSETNSGLGWHVEWLGIEG